MTAARSTPGGAAAAFDLLDYLVRRAGESPRFAARCYSLHIGRPVPCVACLTEQRLPWVVEGRSDVIEVPLEEVVAVVENEEGWLRLVFESKVPSRESRARHPETQLHATFFMKDAEKRALYEALVRKSRISLHSGAGPSAYQELEDVPAAAAHDATGHGQLGFPAW